MGVLDAPHQTRSPEWPIGGTEERITGEGSNANPGPGAYCCASGADCEAGGCTPAYSFGGGAPRCGELPDGSWADEHDPAAFFFLGREFPWYEFKSASFSFDTMYVDCFCGDRGPRTIFSIEGVRGIKVRKNAQT